MAVMAAGLMLLAPEPAAAGPDRLNWGAALHAGATSCPNGTLVINAVQKVIGDTDSGFGGGWATDDFVRQIKVVKLSATTFCATVSYEGNFTTYAGISPSGTSTVGPDVVGSFQGGYTSTIFTGTLNPAPAVVGGTSNGVALRTKGSIGTFDYGCDVNFNCPGYFDWVAAYFTTSAGFDLSWWGWIYHGGHNGTWVNQIAGSTGDITGN
jgi:hypothetical protein